MRSVEIFDVQSTAKGQTGSEGDVLSFFPSFSFFVDSSKLLDDISLALMSTWANYVDENGDNA